MVAGHFQTQLVGARGEYKLVKAGTWAFQPNRPIVPSLKTDGRLPLGSQDLRSAAARSTVSGIESIICRYQKKARWVALRHQQANP